MFWVVRSCVTVSMSINTCRPCNRSRLQGLAEEGFKTAGGMYEFLWNQCGLAYQTPEAFLPSGNFRSLSYMRPYVPSYPLHTCCIHVTPSTRTPTGLVSGPCNMRGKRARRAGLQCGTSRKTPYMAMPSDRCRWTVSATYNPNPRANSVMDGHNTYTEACML